MQIFAFSVLFCAFLWSVVESAHKPCQLREYASGYVCVCNETYCDTFDVEKPQQFGEYIVVSSTKAGQRFAVTKGRFVRPAPHPNVIRVRRFANTHDEEREFEGDEDSKATSNTLTIDREEQYQKIVGFGGAFTGSVSYLLNLMSRSLRHALYKNYYAQDEGIGYSMMRIPIGGCDFDLNPWAYNEQPANDVKLTNFTRLDSRDLQRIEQINELKEVAQIDDIKIIGAAWSPPRWMKTNNAWSGRNSLRPEYYQTWADYHLQYLRLMATQNVSYYAISTGNEPQNGIIAWMFVHFMSLGLFSFI